MITLLREAALAARRDLADKRVHAIGCVVVRADGVRVESRNGSSKLPEPSAHAETRALRKAGLRATLLLATRVRKDGSWGLAKPCRACMARIHAQQVKAVCYTIENDHYGLMKL